MFHCGRRLLLLVLPVVAGWPALACAQADSPSSPTVWRCHHEGRVAYGDQPCPGGQPMTISDPRSAADVAEARLVAQRERALAQQMVAERQVRQRHQQARGSGLAGVEPAPVPVIRSWAPEPWQPPAPPRRRRPAAAA